MMLKINVLICFSRTHDCISCSSHHFDYVSTKHIAYLSLSFFCCFFPLFICIYRRTLALSITAGKHHWIFKTSSTLGEFLLGSYVISFHPVVVTRVSHFHLIMLYLFLLFDNGKFTTSWREVNESIIVIFSFPFIILRLLYLFSCGGVYPYYPYCCYLFLLLQVR